MVDSPTSHKKYTKPQSAAGDGMWYIFMKDQSFKCQHVQKGAKLARTLIYYLSSNYQFSMTTRLDAKITMMQNEKLSFRCAGLVRSCDWRTASRASLATNIDRERQKMHFFVHLNKKEFKGGIIACTLTCGFSCFEVLARSARYHLKSPN